MDSFVELTEIGNPDAYKLKRTFWINPNCIASIQVDDESDTLIMLADGRKFYVVEAPMDICERLRAGHKHSGMVDPIEIEAAAKIEQLRAAIKPLASVALWSDACPDCKVDHICDYNLSLCFTVDEIKAAREAVP